MTEFVPLPIAPEQGFPQSFRLSVAGVTYAIALYVNVTDETDRPPDHVYDLSRPGAFMVMQVAREAPAAPEVIFRRRLVTGHSYHARELRLLAGHSYHARELRLRFDELLVDRRNVNGVGSFGSSVKGGVALRWPS